MELKDYYPEQDLSRARTIPARWYTNPQMLMVEKEKIFSRTWQAVGRTDFVSKNGDYFVCEIQGEPVVVVRGNDGVLRAFSNVCRHRAGPVATDAGNRTSLQCRYHGWTYALDGRLLAQPEFEGVQDWDKSSVSLPSFRIETWGPLIFVHLAVDPIPLREMFGNIPSEVEANGFPLDRLQFLERRDYTIRCNWKVYIDNYLEGYHIPMVHPGLFKELDYERYRVNTFRYYSSQDAPIRPSKNSDHQRRYADAKTDALYYWIFPNLMLSVYPDHLHSTIVLPLGPDKTLTTFEWFFRKSETDEERSSSRKTIEFTEEVQQQDIAICEAVQRGLQSRTYHQGRYSVKRENGVHHFHQLLHEYLARP